MRTTEPRLTDAAYLPASGTGPREPMSPGTWLVVDGVSGARISADTPESAALIRAAQWDEMMGDIREYRCTVYPAPVPRQGRDDDTIFSDEAGRRFPARALLIGADKSVADEPTTIGR